MYALRLHIEDPVLAIVVCAQHRIPGPLVARGLVEDYYEVEVPHELDPAFLERWLLLGEHLVDYEKS